MKEILISAGIIIAIIISNILVSNFVDDKLNHIGTLLDEVAPILEEENYEEAAKKVDEIDKYLNESEATISCYIEHDELEKVQNSLTTLKAYIKMESDDAYSEAKSMAFIIEHIEEKDDLKIKNIF